MRKLKHPGTVMGLFALGLEATGVASGARHFTKREFRRRRPSRRVKVKPGPEKRCYNVELTPTSDRYYLSIFFKTNVDHGFM